MDELYIGLMSGTSNDGIDAALVNLSGQGFKLLATHYQAYPDDIKSQLTQLIRQQQISLGAFSKLDHTLAVLNALAVNKLLQTAKINKVAIKAIGYHGQTIHHCPDKDAANSIQIGDPNFLAAHTQIPVVADFRRMDMAVAGQGAPLVPAFHQFLFQHQDRHRAILNIGGIANLTILPAGTSSKLIGFDTGPGNALLDDWNLQHNKTDYDHAGNWAAQGSCDQTLLQKLFADAYFSQSPPKSTGREYFNMHWLQQFDIEQHSPQTIQTTLSHLTAYSIEHAIVDYAPKTQEVYICGGGVNNEYMINLLTNRLTTIELASTEQLGLHPDWVEACAFAWLAQRRILEKPGNVSSVTGADKSVLLGAVYKDS